MEGGAFNCDQVMEERECVQRKTCRFFGGIFDLGKGCSEVTLKVRMIYMGEKVMISDVG